MIELFEHTADLGLRVVADSFAALCAEGAYGLYGLLVDDLAAVRAEQRETIEIDGADDETLYFDWLAELLYRFDGEQRVYARFEIERDEKGLRVEAWGEPYDPARHGRGREVKAITYHGLRVTREGERWVAEVIVDV